jgi:uncharacterized protein YbbK (DUF523 family)
VKELKQYVRFSPVCPEVGIGLGVPREPVRIVSVERILKLIQPATDLEVTRRMGDFANGFLDSVSDVDGFILKSRSPSCGIKEGNPRRVGPFTFERTNSSSPCE